MTAAKRRELTVIDAGVMPYSGALTLQKSLVAAKKRGEPRDYLVLVEHNPVITLGRRADEAHLKLPRDALWARGVEVYDCERGGDVTFHGPGQLVGYPIIDLKRAGLGVAEYLRFLEDVIIESLRRLGVEGFRRPRLTGVWTAQGKVASIGIAVTRWISFHGFALNVNTDLSAFEMIVPCGLAGEKVTSISGMTGTPADMAAVKSVVAGVLRERLGARTAGAAPVATGEAV